MAAGAGAGIVIVGPPERARRGSAAEMERPVPAVVAWVLTLGASFLVCARMVSRADLCGLLLCLLVLAVAAAALARGDPSGPTLRWLDPAVLAVFGATFLSAQLSGEAVSSRGVLGKQAFEVGTYFLLRLALRRRSQWVALLWSVSGLGLLLALVDASGVLFQAREFASSGLDITQVRHLLSGIRGVTRAPPGEWATFYLALLPFPVVLATGFARDPASGWLGAASALSVAVSVLLTLARGAYVGLLAFMLVGTGCWAARRMVPLRKLGSSLAVCALATAAVVAATPFRSAVLKTATLKGSESYQRSLESRRQLWRTAVRLAEPHILLGTGPGTFPIRHLAARGEEDERPFVARPMNVVAHVLVEEGALGLVAWLQLWGVLAWTCLQRMRAPGGTGFATGAWLLAAAVGLAIRDMTYSSLLTHPGVGVLAAAMLALAAARDPS